MRLPAATSIAHVHLKVRNMERTLSFYENLLGFQAMKKDGSTVSLSSASGERPRIILMEDPQAVPRSPQSPGLFHVAILYPNRKALANAFRRLHEGGYSFQGFADHGVSEALYLADPEGNGIELYCDRPREDWPVKDGELQMVTAPLDLEDLLKEATSANEILHPETRIGHLHLQVSDLNNAAQFYVELLGFDVTQRSYPGALFVAAGGYHHHIGLNTWNSRGMSPAPSNATGLIDFAIHIPDEFVIDALREKALSSNVPVTHADSGLLISDKDGISVQLVS